MALSLTLYSHGFALLRMAVDGQRKPKVGELTPRYSQLAYQLTEINQSCYGSIVSPSDT